INFSDLMTAKISSDHLEHRVKENPHLKKMQDELLNASHSPEKIGNYLSAIAVFDTDPLKLIERTVEVNQVVTDNSIIVW
ncbi:hypothetical protein ACQJ2X_30515, partial [Bacillus wiedmannii]